MGVREDNIGHGHDFATGEDYFEFHRRIVLPKDVVDKVAGLLSIGDIDQAKQLLIDRSPGNAQNLISACLEGLRGKAVART
jgi:hypothetical protein